MRSTVQARRPALNLRSRAPEQAARGKGKAYDSVESVPRQANDDLSRSEELLV